MSWKDYLYFQKGDRIAIIILLISIIVFGGIYFLSIPDQSTKTEPLSKLEEDFLHFQAELTDIVKSDSSNQYKNKHSTSHHNKVEYPYSSKLKTGETIEINEADTSLLKRIPGIGTSYANRIVKYRNLLGGYSSIEQLKEVWGMDNELFDKIISYISIEAKVQRLQINSIDFKALIKHPYINHEQAKVIIDIRERKGKIESIRRLALLDEFTETDIKRLEPYLSFD